MQSWKPYEDTDRFVPGSHPMTSQIFAVIVLYGVEVDQCVTYRDLLRSAALLDGAPPPFILLYDNSPEAQTPAALPVGVSYHHAERNGGVAAAYNYALQLSLDRKCEWLLTLDQDTSLPEQFLLDLVPLAARLTPMSRVAVILPQVFHGERMISPHFYIAGAWPRFLAPGFVGTAPEPLFAINSGSLLRTAALVAVGGYDPAFWLDASDHVLFSRLAHAGRTCYVLGSLRVQQALSHLDRSQPVSPARLKNILSAESAFWDVERSTFAGIAYTFVLFRHFLGMVCRREAAELRLLVLKSITNRLLQSRRSRVALWRAGRLG